MSFALHQTVDPWSARSKMLAPGSYVTDGRRLFRVVSQFNPGGRDVLASLEDCLTLEVASYAPDELYSMGIRRVSMDGRGVAMRSPLRST